MKRFFITALIVVSLAGCSTTSVGLKYSPPATLTRASSSAQPVIVGNFLDQRDVPANWLGAIRGGFGNPLKYLESDRPVAEIVKIAFIDGLQARGITID